MLLSCAAVLFDCDGVLVDSEVAVDTAWRRWAGDLGIDPDDLLATVHGRRSGDTVRAWLPADRVTAELARINRYEVEDVASITPIPGAADLLAAMPAGTWAVVTSGNRALATARLQAAGLPAPLGVGINILPHAARELGVAAARTVVGEDTAAGMRAGRAAGVGHVLGVGRRDDDGDPDVRVADLRAVHWTGAGLDVG